MVKTALRWKNSSKTGSGVRGGEHVSDKERRMKAAIIRKKDYEKDIEEQKAEEDEIERWQIVKQTKH